MLSIAKETVNLLNKQLTGQKNLSLPAMDLTDDQCLEHTMNSQYETPRKQTIKLKQSKEPTEFLKRNTMINKYF